MVETQVDVATVSPSAVRLQRIDLMSGERLGAPFRSIFVHAAVMTAQIRLGTERPESAGWFAEVESFRDLMAESGSALTGWHFFDKSDRDYGPDSDTTALVAICAQLTHSLPEQELRQAAALLKQQQRGDDYLVWLSSRRTAGHRLNAIDPVVTANVAGALLRIEGAHSIARRHLDLAVNKLDTAIRRNELHRASLYYRSDNFVKLLLGIHAREGRCAALPGPFTEGEILFRHGHRRLGYILSVTT